jgi:hypothetical protein
MLTIKNIENIKSKEFTYEGRQWVLYGVDASNIEYKFIFMPRDSIAMVYIISKAQIVFLDRTKKVRGINVLGYRLWTTDGKHTYLNAKDIPDWCELVHMIFKNKMICLQ